ncbi:MAG: FAD-binding oxidoreductase [Candidatus Competibacterales bacterium]|nr:FAD-binding oxidoreductase [Candidatus Competibacterales bacterium]
MPSESTAVGYEPSYYSASTQIPPARPALQGSHDCEVAVIGGGLTGVSAALHLAERGYRTVLLEARRIGWGASGRNGGQVHHGYASGQAVLERQLGREAARQLWQLSQEAVALLRHRIERHRIDCDLRSGLMLAALKPRHRRELQHWRNHLARDCGYETTEWLEGKALREALASPRYCAALYDPGGAHLQPLDYVLGLARAATEAGAELYEQSPVTALDSGPRPRLRTRTGTLRCRHLLLCGNAYLDRLAPAIRRKIMPVGTYLITTEPLGEDRAHALIPSGAAVSDIRFVLDYFRLSADHRLLFGGGVSYSTLPPPGLAALMRTRMLRVFPQLADVRVEHCWGGYVAITLNRAPHFGRLADNVFFAHGFSGHGLALTGLAGQVLAEAVAGQAGRFDLFARIRHRDFPGGALLRTPLLMLAMTYYRLRDLL